MGFNSAFKGLKTGTLIAQLMKLMLRIRQRQLIAQLNIKKLKASTFLSIFRWT